MPRRRAQALAWLRGRFRAPGGSSGTFSPRDGCGGALCSGALSGSMALSLGAPGGTGGGAFGLCTLRMRLAYINSEAAKQAIPRVAELMATHLKWDKKEKAKQEKARKAAFLAKERSLKRSVQTSVQASGPAVFLSAAGNALLLLGGATVASVVLFEESSGGGKEPTADMTAEEGADAASDGTADAQSNTD